MKYGSRNLLIELGANMDNNSKKIKVLHLIPSLTGGGAERQIQMVIPLLDQQGFENHVLYLYGDECRNTLGLPAQQLHFIPVSNNYSPRILIGIIRVIHKIQPDLIHSWIRQMDILAGLLSTFYHIPWVLREPSCASDRYKHWKYWLRARLAAKTTAIMANSLGGRNYWHSIYPDKEIQIIPNILDKDAILKTPPADRMESGLNEKNKIILYAGRLDKGKNLKFLIESLGAVLKDDPSLIFLICGQGSEFQALNNTVEAAGIAAQVQFCGTVSREKLWSMMKIADIFAFLSLSEGQPNAVLEAAACGLPLLLSDIPAHRDIFDETSAKFVPTDNMDAVIKSITGMLHSDNSIQVANAHRILDSFDSNQIIMKYRIFYNKAIQLGRKFGYCIVLPVIQLSEISDFL